MCFSHCDPLMRCHCQAMCNRTDQMCPAMAKRVAASSQMRGQIRGARYTEGTLRPEGRMSSERQHCLSLQLPLQMWWYKTWVWQWIEEQRLSELRGAAAPTIAFHIRGGDIFAADKAQASLQAAHSQLSAVLLLLLPTFALSGCSGSHSTCLAACAWL